MSRSDRAREPQPALGPLVGSRIGVLTPASMMGARVVYLVFRLICSELLGLLDVLLEVLHTWVIGGRRYRAPPEGIGGSALWCLGEQFRLGLQFLALLLGSHFRVLRVELDQGMGEHRSEERREGKETSSP